MDPPPRSQGWCISVCLSILFKWFVQVRCVNVDVCVDVCVLDSFRGGKKAPIGPRVHAIQQVAVPFDMEMSFPSASNLEEAEDVSDEGEDFPSDNLEVPTLMETVSACFYPWGQLYHDVHCGKVLQVFGTLAIISLL